MKIKQFKGATVLFGVLLFFAACNDDELDYVDSVQQPTTLGFESPALELDVQGSPVELAVSIAGKMNDWELTSSADWLQLEKGTTDKNGKTEYAAIVSATQNTGYSRSATVSVTVDNGSEEISKSFEVLQETALEEPNLGLSQSQLNFSAQGEQLELSIETNQDNWSYDTEADWLSFEKNGNNLLITAAGNTELDARSALVTFAAGLEPFTARDTLYINQAKPDNEESITISGIELILVKAGTYYRGAQSTDPQGPNYYPDAAANQGPVHQVTITKDFYIGKYELTQAQFEAVMGYNPSDTQGRDHPVEMVPWPVAKEFTDNLSQQTGRAFRLPTEAEWEYAARGGQKSQGYIYSGSNNPADVAYHFQDGGDQREKGVTVPVGTLAPNELGIHDMSGNVYEWVLDHMEAYSGPVTDPVGQGDRRVLRGGSWYHNKFSQANSYRGSNTDDFSRAYLGFRVIYVPEQ